MCSKDWKGSRLAMSLFGNRDRYDIQSHLEVASMKGLYEIKNRFSQKQAKGSNTKYGRSSWSRLCTHL